MDETLAAEISIKRKEIVFVVTYDSPSQKAENFHLFLDRIQLTIDYIKDIKPYSIVLRLRIIAMSAILGISIERLLPIYQKIGITEKQIAV